ncbi:MAG TPA: nuclear transport factor 2 family protein, partial [Vicinamibacteria bacterium]
AVAQEYVEAWKAGDAAGCASIYSDDADVIDFMGMTAKGKAAIQESIGKTLGTFQGSSIQIVRTGIHVVAADVVVSDGTWEVVGSKAPEGTPTKGFYTVAVAKQGDAWQVVSGRTKVAPPSN